MHLTEKRIHKSEFSRKRVLFLCSRKCLGLSLLLLLCSVVLLLLSLLLLLLFTVPFVECPLDEFEGASEDLGGEFEEHHATNQHSEHG